MAIHFHIAAAETWFLVPASVVTEHLAKATETELKVLLRLLHGGREADEQDLLRTLSLTERQLKEAVAAWISRGVLCMEGSLVTLAQPPLTFAKPERRTAEAPTRPEYHMEAVEQALAQNEALREVLRRAPQALGREVGPTEFARLYSLYDYYGLSPEAILRLFAYCHALRRTSWM